MYPELESCEHILEDLYSYALDRGVSPKVVDDAVNRAYWSHKSTYDRFERRLDSMAYQLKSHQLGVHLLEHHVRPELEDIVSKSCCGGGCHGGG
ncbi:TPA: hypothetical protein HA265_00430 [Candidatus Woesearchaeota archaeon]|nr:hypothetical protein [Candidatus Woesearchaeota archaeon]